MAQITFIFQIPGSPPAQRVENIGDNAMNEFLDALIADRFPGSTRQEAAQKWIDFMFEDLANTSVSYKRRNVEITDILGRRRGRS